MQLHLNPFYIFAVSFFKKGGQLLVLDYLICARWSMENTAIDLQTKTKKITKKNYIRQT